MEPGLLSKKQEKDHCWFYCLQEAAMITPGGNWQSPQNTLQP